MNVNKSNPWDTAYKLAANKIKPSTFLTTLQKSDGSYTADLQDTLNTLMDKFIPEDLDSDDLEEHRDMRMFLQNDINTSNDIPFTLLEIKAALFKSQPNKTPGEDGITNLILQKVFQIVPNIITTIYNECLTRGVFPKLWKSSIILPIMKPGKQNVVGATKYRPINFLSTGGKLLERLMIDRIMHFLYKNDLLSIKQYGFRPQSSSIDAVLAVKKFVDRNLTNKMKILLISLDVEGAFDAAWWPAILCQLYSFNCPRNLYQLALNYFCNRKASLKMETCEVIRHVTRGCPQGSCCGPGFWTIQFDSLLKLNFPANSEAVAFADDYILMVAASSNLELEIKANDILKQIGDWSVKNKIKFSADKSCALYVNRRHSAEYMCLYLNNYQLKIVNEMKYLGITLNKDWNWNSHINSITEKCMSFMNILSRSAKVHWGLGQDALRVIYDGAFVPMLLYGISVWFDGLQRSYNKRKLNSVQRIMAIRLIRGYRTISHDAACILAGIIPICIKAKQLAMEGLAVRGNQVEGLDPTKMEMPVPLNHWPHPASYELFLNIESECNMGSTADFCIYTDGSLKLDKVGCAFVAYHKENIIEEAEFRLGPVSSNNQAELLAILKALDWLCDLEYRDQMWKVIIFTDSQVSIDTLANWRKQTELAFNIRKKLFDLRNKVHITFTWTKSHIGTAGNERADFLAKEGATNEDLVIIFNKYPLSYIKKYFHAQSLEEWETFWTNSTKGHITRQFFPSIHGRIKMDDFVPTFKLTQILTGHGKIRAYLEKYKILESAMCPCNNIEEQTVNHLIFNCSLLEAIRAPLIRTVATLGYSWPPDIKLLVTEDIIKSFETFVNQIDFNDL